MAEEFSVQNPEFLRDRAYYSEIPRHVLLLPDGSRRFAHAHNLTDAEVYDISQRKCIDFLDVCFNEFDIEIATIFLLRPSSFDKQRRTEDNLEAILLAIKRLVEGASDSYASLNMGAITLAGEPWMEMPERVRKSEGLSWAWETLKETLGSITPTNQPEKRRKLNFLINYSGKKELDYALQGGDLQISEQVGVAIRTGDGMRLSDCPLYALSESHLCLIPKFLPETTNEDYREALRKYYKLSERAEGERGVR